MASNSSVSVIHHFQTDPPSTKEMMETSSSLQNFFCQMTPAHQGSKGHVLMGYSVDVLCSRCRKEIFSGEL